MINSHRAQEEVQLINLPENNQPINSRRARFFYNVVGSKKSILIDHILYCKSMSNYTCIHLITGKKIILSKTLKYCQDALPVQEFLRVHASYLINKNYVEGIIKKKNGIINLNGIMIPISRNKKSQVIDQLI